MTVITAFTKNGCTSHSVGKEEKDRNGPRNCNNSEMNVIVACCFQIQSFIDSWCLAQQTQNSSAIFIEVNLGLFSLHFYNLLFKYNNANYEASVFQYISKVDTSDYIQKAGRI